jgi:hypothetical protein
MRKTTTLLRHLFTGVLTLGAALTLTTFSGGPAAAHYSQCPDNEFCIWDDSSYEGRFAYSSEPQPNVGDYMNDRMTSYWNRTDNWVTVYSNDKFQGCLLTVPPGYSDAAINWTINDMVTSFRPGRFC